MTVNPAGWWSQEEKKEFTSKSHIKAFLLLFYVFSFYAFCLLGAVADYSLIANILFSVLGGFAIGGIFVIGHDAIHKSLVANLLLNQIIGRITLVIALHSSSLWELFHNQMHHGFTNIKDKDPSWSPKTLQEFQAMSRPRQWLERLYRSPLGAGIYYINEIWLRLLVFPLMPEARGQWKKHLPDTIFVLLNLPVQLAVVLLIGHAVAPEKPDWLLLLLGWAIPFLTWNYLSGVSVYLHHTHPNIAWYNAENKTGNFSWRIVESTTRVEYPRLIHGLFLNIMEHTAHHLSTSIPTYNLKRSQRRLEAVADSSSILVFNFNLKTYLNITRCCKLYDFVKHCWTDFEGCRTGPVLQQFAEQLHTGHEAGAK